MSGNNDQLISLSNLTLGQKALIVGFSFTAKEGEATQEMGLTPGEQLEVVRLAPLGGPIEIKIRGYFLSLRKEDADCIKIKLFS